MICDAYGILLDSYFPSALITTSNTMTTKSPAEETAAAVSSPDIAAATVSPERTNMIMKRTMIPKGVRMMPIIEPDPLAIQHTPPKKDKKRGAGLKLFNNFLHLGD